MAVPYQTLPDDPSDPGGGGGGGGTPPPSSYGTVVFDLNFTKLDASSALDITCYMNCYNQDDLRYSAYLFVDDQLLQVGTTNAVFDQQNSKAQQTMTLVAIIQGIPAGAHNCKLRVKNRETEGPLVVQAGSLIKITELRQGAR
jgi:hypothetical protein